MGRAFTSSRVAPAWNIHPPFAWSERVRRRGRPSHGVEAVFGGTYLTDEQAVPGVEHLRPRDGLILGSATRLVDVVLTELTLSMLPS
jgi:hypothetical protein